VITTLELLSHSLGPPFPPSSRGSDLGELTKMRTPLSDDLIRTKPLFPTTFLTAAPPFQFLNWSQCCLPLFSSARPVQQSVTGSSCAGHFFFPVIPLPRIYFPHRHVRCFHFRFSRRNLFSAPSPTGASHNPQLFKQSVSSQALLPPPPAPLFERPFSPPLNPVTLPYPICAGGHGSTPYPIILLW